METAENAGDPVSTNELTVVDIGTQIQETTEDILPYIDDDTAGKEFLDLSDNPRAEIYGGPSAYPLFEYKRADESGQIVESGEITESIGTDALDSMRSEYGIDRSVVNPTMNLSLAETNNDRFALALAKGYNRWLLEELDDRDSLVGNLIVAPQHPERAADEIDELASEGSIVGVTIPIAGMLPAAGHRIYEPIWEAAAKHELPVTLQGTVGIRSFHQQVYSADSYAMDYAYQQPFLAMQHLTSIMFEGVLDRHPETNVVVLNAGIDLAPYLVMRLDDHYLELGYEIPALDRLPSEYCADSVYWGTAPIGHASNQPTPDYMAKMVRMVGAENVLYSSDIPHPVTESPSNLLDEIGSALDADEIEALFGGTARELYGL